MQEELSSGLPTYPLPSQWLLSRLNCAVGTVVSAMEAYDFATTTQKLYGENWLGLLAIDTFGLEA